MKIKIDPKNLYLVTNAKKDKMHLDLKKPIQFEQNIQEVLTHNILNNVKNHTRHFESNRILAKNFKNINVA